LRVPSVAPRRRPRGPRPPHRHGARQQHDRADPDDRAHRQPGRLSPQRHGRRDARGGVREGPMRSIALTLAPAARVVAQPPCRGEEKPGALKSAPGLDKVEANCAACHSLDYVVTNSPFLNAAQWDATVTKMINAFGAPIDAADAKAIADYLKANYGG